MKAAFCLGSESTVNSPECHVHLRNAQNYSPYFTTKTRHVVTKTNHRMLLRGRKELLFIMRTIESEQMHSVGKKQCF